MTDEELCKALRSALWGQGHHINIKAADRIEALTEKLTKAVEALRDMCAEFRGHDLPYGSKAYVKATTTLAEIEGEKE